VGVSSFEAVTVALGAALALYAVFVLSLVVLGRRSEAAVVARLIPDCVRLFRRLLADRRVSRRRRLVLVCLVAYLLMPIDLVPDFIPVAGQLDDAIVVALALRVVLRGAGPELLAEHWPGPDATRDVIARLAFGARADQSIG
jgi:uncharacterized membrane protein YkvA (DUF1232 family)